VPGLRAFYDEKTGKACLAGHMATWPEFNKKGLAGSSSYPVLFTDSEALDTWSAGNKLFGNQELFRSTGNYPAPDAFPALNDHEIVINRLRHELGLHFLPPPNRFHKFMAKIGLPRRFSKEEVLA
jgi:hypothetical protein